MRFVRIDALGFFRLTLVAAAAAIYFMFNAGPEIVYSFLLLVSPGIFVRFIVNGGKKKTNEHALYLRFIFVFLVMEFICNGFKATEIDS